MHKCKKRLSQAVSENWKWSSSMNKKKMQKSNQMKRFKQTFKKGFEKEVHATCSQNAQLNYAV